VSKYRVMVVDDDADVRFVVTSLLSLDFETVQATNGLDALEKFERYEPDLLLLDVTMPIMNGFQCCRAVRKREDYTDLPVFFLSAMSDPKVLAEAKESGATDYVEKPFDTKALIDRIREHLYGQRIPPRMKLFTMREIEKIDATPLTAASRDESEEETLNPAQNASSTGVPALSLAPPPEPGGRGKTPPPRVWYGPPRDHPADADRRFVGDGESSEGVRTPDCAPTCRTARACPPDRRSVFDAPSASPGRVALSGPPPRRSACSDPADGGPVLVPDSRV
jgi:CheY-like chemotaxis protein